MLKIWMVDRVINIYMIYSNISFKNGPNPICDSKFNLFSYSVYLSCCSLLWGHSGVAPQRSSTVVLEGLYWADICSSTGDVHYGGDVGVMGSVRHCAACLMAAQSYQRETGWGGQGPLPHKSRPVLRSCIYMEIRRGWYGLTRIIYFFGTPPIHSPHFFSLPASSSPPFTSLLALNPPFTFALQTFFLFGLVVLSCFAVAQVTSFRRNIKGHEKGGLDRGPVKIMKFVHIQAKAERSFRSHLFQSDRNLAVIALCEVAATRDSRVSVCVRRTEPALWFGSRRWLALMWKHRPGLNVGFKSPRRCRIDTLSARAINHSALHAVPEVYMWKAAFKWGFAIVGIVTGVFCVWMKFEWPVNPLPWHRWVSGGIWGGADN